VFHPPSRTVFDRASISHIVFGRRRPEFATTLTLFIDIGYSNRNDFVIRQPLSFLKVDETFLKTMRHDPSGEADRLDSHCEK